MSYTVHCAALLMIEAHGDSVTMATVAMVVAATIPTNGEM